MNEIDKIKRRLKNKIPGAELKKDINGNMYVEYRGINLSQQHLLPNATNELDAWMLAELSVKLTQNFNRTHPSRIDGYSLTETGDRVKRRSSMVKTRRELNQVPYFWGLEDE